MHACEETTSDGAPRPDALLGPAIQATGTLHSSRNAVPRISVVVPGYNPGERLRECLQSLCSQDYPDFEVIFVDNGSTDDSRKIAAMFPKVRYVYYNHRKSSYAARNEGVRHATGTLLLFFDSDQITPTSLLETLAGSCVQDDPYHIYLPARLVDDPRVPEVLRRFFPMTESDEPPADRINTACTAIPRQLFDEFGGFKEDILSHGDREFFSRAGQRAQVHAARAVDVRHYHSRTIRDFLKREERYGFGKCLFDAEMGRTPPRVSYQLIGLAIACVIESFAAMATPVLHPRCDWQLRWSAQVLRCRCRLARVIGTAKYKCGGKRAGDLPVVQRSEPAD